MALQPCRECGKEISTETSACPHCGAGHPTTGPSSDTAKRLASAESLKATGEAMGALGCLLTLLVTVPILIIVLLALMS